MIDHNVAAASNEHLPARAQTVDGVSALRAAAALLAEQLARPIAPGDPLDVFRGLLRPEVLRAFVDADLACLIGNEAYQTKNAPAGQLRLFASDTLVVRARLTKPGRAPSRIVSTLTRHTLLGNAGRAPFVLRRWQVPERRNDVFDPALRATAMPAVVLAPGEAVAFRAGTDAYEVSAEAGVAAVALTAAGAHAVPLAWQCDRATGRPLRAEPARTEWLLIRELLTFAEMIGDASLAPALDEVADHPSHFIRWAAGKAATRVAPDGGRAAMLRLAGDEHPQIRAAARGRVVAEAAS